MRYGSVCSGIEAATVAWHPLGWTPSFFAEIEAAPRAVLSHHYPKVPLHGDFTTISAGEYAPIDILVGGTPCQSFSVAGLRGGLDDARGNLTLEFLRLVGRIKPRHVVWENVPGVLSIDGGSVFRTFLDGLEALGYVVDVDILDAQFFGLAQRRRRVFVWGQTAVSILNQKTISSGLTVAQLVAEICRLILAGRLDRSKADLENWAFDASDARLSLRKRMKLFGLDKAEAALMLAENLDALRPSSACAREGSAYHHGKNSRAASKSSGGTRSRGSTEATEVPLGACQNTDPLSSESLGALLRIASAFITSTSENVITIQAIYLCARTLQHTAALIAPSMNSSPPFWSAASSALTATEAFTSYARSSTSDLFADLEWVRPWGDFLGEAERTGHALRNLRVRNFGKVPPIAASLSGHPAPRREAGARIAGALAAGSGGGCGPDDNSAQAHHLVAGTLGATSPGGGWRIGADEAAANHIVAAQLAPAISAGNPYGDHESREGLLVAHSLRAEGFDASEDGTGRGTPIVPGAHGGNDTRGPIHVATAVNAHGGPHGRLDFESETFIAFDTTQVTHAQNRSNPQPDDPCHPLAASGHAPAIAFNSRQDPDVTWDRSGALGSSHPQAEAVAYGQGGGRAVRRLTPREAERLQGFPDDYTAVPWRSGLMADGPRYRMLGNSMAVNCMRWIGTRIEMVETLPLPALSPPPPFFSQRSDPP